MELYESRDALAAAADSAVSERLTQGGLLVVAGGSTPAPVYDRLSQRDLPWDKITVTLTDERRVDLDSDDSNEKMVRTRLLTGKATAAPFVPLRTPALAPREESIAAEMRLAPHLPAACVLLGMGEDGHVASLFPDTPELDLGLDLDSARLCLAVSRSGLPPFVPRLTLTARALTQAKALILLVTGEAKRALIERVQRDQAYSPPVATFLRQGRCPARILWAA